MVEVISVSDLVRIFSDLHTRFQAPRRLVGRSRYLLERDDRIRSFLTADFPTIATTVQSTLAKHPALVPPSSSQPRWSSFFNYLRIVARSDAYAELSTDLHSLQNDGLFELLLDVSFDIRERLDTIDIRMYIHPCQNVDAARRLRKSPCIHMDGLDDTFVNTYYPLQNWCRPTHRVEHSRSSWEPTPVAASLFGRELEVRKFAVLVGVAHALTAAHKARWYHRRLAADNIFVKKGLDTLSKLGDIRTDLVKVTDFVCPITGCFDGCSPCKSRTQIAISGGGSFFEAITRRDTVLFSLHSDHGDGRNGELVDSVSFARLIMWIYTGSNAPMNFESMDSLSEGVISCVPWPLRWIVKDCENLSMRVVLLFMRALQAGDIDPHCTRRAFVQTLGRGASNIAARPDTVLYQACLRSVVVGVETEEPEALIHMAKVWEGRALFGRTHDASREKILQHIRCAYECYKYASMLGESEGLVHMARLQCEGLSPHGYHPVENASPIELVRLLAKAIACGNSTALTCLKTVAHKGLPREAGFPIVDQQGENCSDECFVEQEFVDTIVAVAMCLRRGTHGLPMDHNEAIAWLQAAKERFHPRGCLELGLLKVQLRQSVASVREGIDHISVASNTAPTPAAYDAHFWLGKWYHSGLGAELETGNIVVLDRNSRLAVAHVQAGAAGDHPDCMALYSMFFRDGLSPLKRDEGKAKQWNRAAREKQSPIAYYGYAVMMIKQAREAYQALEDASNGACDVPSMTSTEDSVERWLLPKRSSSSDTSDSQASPQKEGYRDASGRVTRRGIARWFELAFVSLTKAGMQLHAIHPEELENPKPLVMAADMIYNNIVPWAACAYENDPEKEQLFRSQKLQEAHGMLEKATTMYMRERWEQLRVNHVQEDLEAMQRARQLLHTHIRPAA